MALSVAEGVERLKNGPDQSPASIGWIGYHQFRPSDAKGNILLPPDLRDEAGCTEELLRLDILDHY
jgi:hypothetical protein